MCVEAFILGEEAERIPQPRVAERERQLVCAGGPRETGQEQRLYLQERKGITLGPAVAGVPCRPAPRFSLLGCLPGSLPGPAVSPPSSEDCTAGLRLHCLWMGSVNPNKSFPERGLRGRPHRAGVERQVPGLGAGPSQPLHFPSCP